MTADLLDRFPTEIRQAVLIRRTEERLLALFAEGQVAGTIHTCVGQELVGVAVARALQPADTVLSNHRCHGHFLAVRSNLVGLVGEILGRSAGACGGRGGSQHLHDGPFSSSGVQGGIAPIAVGQALAHVRSGTGGIAVVFLGDGTLGEGVLYEAMNIASAWELPTLFVCENNLYAQSTHQRQTLAGSITGRAEAFGIATAVTDTWSPAALFGTVADAVERVRSSGRPLFLQIDTYRLNAHSKGDDDRDPEEIRAYRERDPLHALESSGAGDPRWGDLVRGVDEEIEQAVRVAEASPPAELSAVTAASEIEWRPLRFERERVVESIRRALASALAEHEEVILLGEDIESPYGGAFKCTLALSDQFPGRVRNTPISEAAIVGIGNGLALMGLRPVVEIMFGDFLLLAADQWVNHAAKFAWMYDDAVKVPLVVRTPMGGGRGYGPTHSQSLEKHLLGLPGTRVLCLHHRHDAARLYRDLLGTPDLPTLVVENKLLYARHVDPVAPPGFALFETTERFPTVRLRPDGPADLTLVAVGGAGVDAERAALELFEQDEVLVDLFLPTQLHPFDVGVLAESMERTRRLLVVEEGQGFASFSSEVLAQAAERWGPAGLRCGRVTARPWPIPAARALEEQSLPSVADIVIKAREVLRERAG